MPVTGPTTTAGTQARVVTFQHLADLPGPLGDSGRVRVTSEQADITDVSQHRGKEPVRVPDLAPSGDLAKAPLPSARRKLRPLVGCKV